jgi:acid phosphatase
MLLNGMYDTTSDIPLLIQDSTVDSLEPTYRCTTASNLLNSIRNSNANWTAHLTSAASLFQTLDSVSGVSPTDSGWHVSFDHYFDNLSSRLCHAKPLPCALDDTANCVSQDEADEVFRLGQYEYSFTYRDDPRSLARGAAGFGVWVAELAQNLRDCINGANDVVYRHNVAHDGSVSMLLSVLQIDVMVWPGMGAEVVFELFKNAGDGGYYLRVLWGGQVMRSSNPSLGVMDMVPVDTLLGYFDALVGVRASKIVGLCGNSS